MKHAHLTTAACALVAAANCSAQPAPIDWNGDVVFAQQYTPTMGPGAGIWSSLTEPRCSLFDPIYDAVNCDWDDTEIPNGRIFEPVGRQPCSGLNDTIRYSTGTASRYIVENVEIDQPVPATATTFAVAVSRANVQVPESLFLSVEVYHDFDSTGAGPPYQHFLSGFMFDFGVQPVGDPGYAIYVADLSETGVAWNVNYRQAVVLRLSSSATGGATASEMVFWGHAPNLPGSSDSILWVDDAPEDGNLTVGVEIYDYSFGMCVDPLDVCMAFGDLSTIVLEDEPCGSANNDTLVVSDPLTLPGRVCGQLPASGTVDTDWYSFGVSSPMALSTRLSSEGPVDLVLRGPAMGGVAGVVRAAGTSDALSPFTPVVNLAAAGTYTAELSPGVTAGWPCPTPLEYDLQLDAPPCSLESGSCLLDFNEGCDFNDPTAVEPIWIGDSICGALPSLDVDWLGFTLPDARILTWHLDTDFDFDAQFRDIGSGCPGSTVHTTSGGAGDSTVSVWLPAGTYGLRLTHAVPGLSCFTGTQGTYRVTLSDAISNAVDPAVPIVSVASGAWTDPATWNVNEVPGPANTVTVDHVVHVAPDTYAELTVDTLSVGSGGELRATPASDASGAPFVVAVGQLNIDAGGALIAGDGGVSAPGGDLTISLPNWQPVPVTNEGLMRGGNGTKGGAVVVEAFGCDFVTSSGGTTTGGFPAGDVTLSTGSIIVDDATLKTGDPDSSYPSGGIFTLHTIGSTTITNNALLAGPSNMAATGQGNRHGVVAADIILDSTSTIDCSSSSGRWLCLGANSITLDGTVLATRQCIDPPTIIVRGPSRGTELVYAGELLRFGPFAGPGAIDADDSLTIVSHPNGAVDLRFLDAQEYFVAGSSITIKSDLVLTAPGVTLSDLFEPDPVLLPGEIVTELCMSPGSGTTNVVPGQSLARLFTVSNCGNDSATIDATLTDTAGWLLAPMNLRRQFVGVAESLPIEAALAIPANARRGDSTTVSLDVTAANGLNRQVDLAFTVPGCLADWNADGVTNTADFVSYLNDYVAVLNGQAWVFDDPDLAAPFGSLNSSDFIEFLNIFAAGCS